MAALAGDGSLAVARSASLYLHLPFCASRCAYCTFVTSTERELLPRYMAALRQELMLLARLAKRPLRTLYLGGGTPSLLPGDELSELFSVLNVSFPRLPGAEVTLEANPDDVTEERIQLWQSLGVNRVSVGVQSFDDGVLALLSRRHSAQKAKVALQSLLAAGFVVSADIMLGLPGLNRRRLEQTLEVLVQLSPHHVSVYLLEMDKPHRLALLAQRHAGLFPSEEEAAWQYLATARFLQRAGYRHYEVSNWARPGFEARHNLRYWQGGVVLGCGVGAYGQGRNSRWANTSELGEYMASLASSRFPRTWRSYLTPEAAQAERVMLALRLSRGVRWCEAEALAETRPRFWQVFEDFLAVGLARRRGERVRLTPRGWLVSNELFATLV
ncbi:MAG: radical SAM family heme chaperone HemW [Thermoanaerobaculum sp.]